MPRSGPAQTTRREQRDWEGVSRLELFSGARGERFAVWELEVQRSARVTARAHGVGELSGVDSAQRDGEMHANALDRGARASQNDRHKRLQRTRFAQVVTPETRSYIRLLKLVQQVQQLQTQQVRSEQEPALEGQRNQELSLRSAAHL